MAFKEITDRQAIIKAIEECDRLGRERFLEEYGFGQAKAYFLEHQGRHYDSKAIVGAAHGIQFPDLGPLTSSDFSGGENTVARLLEKLGFHVLISKKSPREPRYWAFCANPKRYKVREAVHGLKTGYWIVSGSDVREGDFAVIWQSLDHRGKRGIVAFAKVLSDPVEIEDFEDPCWVKQDELQEKRPRVQVQFHISPRLPLWIDDSPVGDFLRSLSVARATGGTTFHIRPEQWEKLLELSGLRELPFFIRERLQYVEDEGTTLAELLEKAMDKASPQANPEERLSNYYRRSDYIRLYALKRAGGRCEGCGEDAPFQGKTGTPYLEVHHLKWLSDEGPDAPENVIALCPVCHSRVHNGIDGEDYNKTLFELASKRFAGKP
jgi:5-methylcytosine-specific restriction endonuclease McrA